jgi:hypothetical protein
MRRALLVLLLTALVPAGAAVAHERHCRHDGIHIGHVRSPVDWGPRHDLARARFAILTEKREAALVLTRDDQVAIQLSDRVMRDLDREFEREMDEDDGFLAEAIKSAVLGSVRGMLNHSLECPIDELRDARYEDGRLVLVTNRGRYVFDDLEIDDRNALECFSEHDARAFVREFRRAKDRLR